MNIHRRKLDDTKESITMLYLMIEPGLQELLIEFDHSSIEECVAYQNATSQIFTDVNISL